jgi:glutamyl/glutaminyl-tRNA synthetase
MAHMITRIAPTPSGFVHTGNIYNFLLNWLWARAGNGKVLLRIDDADTARKRPEYVTDIFRVLDWLGLYWDIGPAGPDDFEKHWSQLQRKQLYDNLLDELLQKDLLFACTCSRSQLGNTNTLYPGHCLHKGLPMDTKDAAWRVRMKDDSAIQFSDKAAANVCINITDTTGCFVVRKKDGMAAYQITSLADDRHFGITHIARGQDLLPSTAMQLHIDGLLELPYLNHCRFWHHALVKNPEGSKLSKSAGYQSHSLIGNIKKQRLLHAFAQWMEWPQGMGLDAMVEYMRTVQG